MSHPRLCAHTPEEIRAEMTPWQLRAAYLHSHLTLEEFAHEAGCSQSHLEKMIQGQIPISAQFRDRVQLILHARCES